jgi:YggT family protein
MTEAFISQALQLALLQEFGFSISELMLGVVDYAFYILLGFIIASIVFGWFGGYPSSTFLQGVYETVNNVVGPILMPIRSRLPPIRLGGLGLDLSPIIAIIGIWMGSRILTILIELFIRPVVG